MGFMDLANRVASRVLMRRPADSFDTEFHSRLSPIVIGGCGRSGTTLLRTILDSHPRICCGPESNILRRRRLRPDQLAARFGFDRGPVLALYAAATSRPAFIDGFAGLCMRAAGKTRWAEKTPRNIRHVAEIFRQFPDARFVHLLRDGRDVACSLRTHPRHRVRNGKLVPVRTWKPISKCARRWRDDIEISRPFWSDPRFLTIRYEDLMRSPRPVLERLMAFVGEPWDEALLAHTGASSPFRDITKFAQSPEALDPVSTRSINRWERDMNADDRRIFKRVAGALLVELGYAMDDRW